GRTHRDRSPAVADSGRSSRTRRAVHSAPAWSVLAAGRLGTELLAAQLARDRIEHAIDHAWLVTAGEESAGDVDIFGDDDLGGDVATSRQFIGPAAQNRAQRHVDALQRPLGRQ